MADSCDRFPIPRDEIDAWVAAHRAELPHTLAGLAAYPIPFRKAIVRALPRHVVADLWREHLLSFTEPGSGMEPQRTRVIQEAVEAIAAIFGESDAARGQLYALNERIGQLVAAGVFEPRQARDIFATLGPPEPPGGLPLPPGDWSVSGS